MSLYDRVRDGNGCFPHAWSPANSFIRWRLHSNNKTNAFINFPLLRFFAPVVLGSFNPALLRRSYNVSQTCLPCSSQVNPFASHRRSFLGKALVRLVSVGWKCCHSYTSDLSTRYSVWGLTSLCYERSHLVVGFVLICFQHLSAWNTATGRLPLAG